ncbi:MAG: prolyl oligopeptidase family serine peptidase [Terracidiphilus sp.]|nr:prolyl oligopeptidase family serine peptidase [Terracidiphilus sp.]
MRIASIRILLGGIAGAAFAIAAPAGYGQAVSPSTEPKPTAPTTPAAAEPHFPTSEDLRHLKAISAPQLSPDGKQVLFTVTESTADGAKAHLWLAAIGSSADKARQITFSPPADKRGERGPQWAPDGSAIYFLAKRDEHTQLYRLDLRGGEAAPYDLKVLPVVDESKIPGAIPPPAASAATSTEKGADKTSDKKPDDQKTDKKPDAAPEPLALDVSGYSPSPDCKWLAVWARDPETPGEKKQKDAKADASWVNHDLHGTRLYLAALKPDGSVDGALKSVAIAPDVRSALWSPAANSARLLVLTEKPNDASDLGPAGAGWLADATTPEKATKLDGIPATIGRGAAWSQDGTQIAFTAQTPEDAPPAYDELFALIVDASGSGSAHSLSAGFAGQLNAGSLYFAADGSLITLAAVATHSTPVRIAADGKTAPAPVDLGAAVVAGLNTNRNRTGWVWLANGGGESEKLCFAPKLGDPCQTVPAPELEPANLRRVKPQLVQWKSDGLTIEGLLYLPPAAGSGKVPLVVDVHGGPFGAFQDRNDPFVAFLVGHGWAILRPNPRGSSNYGVKFAAANKNDLGGGDYRDVMAGVDAVLQKYPLDPNRMALIGYSYGGEMAGFVEGKTDRFKAIVSGAPVIDQFSEYGTEGGSWYDRWYFGKPWEHMADAWKQSPLGGAAHAKTPFLLIQGDSDSTDPLGQSEEMYRALRQEGVPVEMVTYPREDHGPLAQGIFGYPSPEPWHGFDGRKRIVEFIEKGFATATAKP